MERIASFLFWTIALVTLAFSLWIMAGCTFTNPTLWKNLIRNQAEVFEQMIDDSTTGQQPPCAHSDIYIY